MADDARGERGSIALRTVELRIAGVVQGVGYRASTRRKALSLGLSGWVRNEANGDVRARVRGPAADVEALTQWCHRGPPMSRVDAVDVQMLPDEPSLPAEFVIRR